MLINAGEVFGKVQELFLIIKTTSKIVKGEYLCTTMTIRN